MANRYPFFLWIQGTPIDDGDDVQYMADSVEVDFQIA